MTVEPLMIDGTERYACVVNTIPGLMLLAEQDLLPCIACMGSCIKKERRKTIMGMKLHEIGGGALAEMFDRAYKKVFIKLPQIADIYIFDVNNIP